LVKILLLIISQLQPARIFAVRKQLAGCWPTSQGNRGRKNQSVSKTQEKVTMWFS